MRSALFLGIVVVVVFVAAIAILAWRSTLQYRADQQWVTHTHQVLEALNAVLARIRDAESSVRGYIATGNEAFLGPYEKERESILKSDDELRKLIVDNPAQLARVDRLHPILTARVNRFDELIQLRKTAGEAAAASGLTPGRVWSEKAYTLLREMEGEERLLLTVRAAEGEQSFGRTLALLGVLGAAVLAILAGLFFSARQASLAQVRADDILRRSRAELQDLYDHAPCGYLATDPKGAIRLINATALKWLGYSREELQGEKRIHDLLAPESLAGFTEALTTLHDKGTSITGMESTFRKKDGSPLIVHIGAAAEKDEQGAFQRARFTLVDVTDRKLAQVELDRFFVASIDLKAVADLKTGRFLRVSPSWEPTLGWTSQELTSRSWLDFIHPDDVETTIQAASQLAEGKPLLAFQNRFRHKDGQYRWISWRVPAPLPGSLVAYSVGRDVTESRMQEEEIRILNASLKQRVEETLSANKELEAFSYSVSHDLRAPLRGIDGFSRILMEEYAPTLGKEGLRLLGKVIENSRQMGELIDDLLQYSRLGRKEVETSLVDMESLARDAIQEVRKDRPDCTAELHLGSLPPARGDRSLLKQVWLNLISNAVKYSSKKKEARIDISGENGAGDCVYHVRDNGVGFDMKYSDKLFGVFQRLHSTRDFEGTGVGLAIVQRVIQRHGGRVWAEGQPDAGAVFHFSIPAPREA